MAEFNLTAPAFLLEYRSVTLYQEWLNLGNEGTMADFIAWLRTPATEAAAQALQAAAAALDAAQTLGQGIAAAEAAATLANTKAGLANDAAVLATEKAALVDSAATLANTKAGLANDAAILATEKASLADSKATLANDKAILAQSAADNANAKAAEVTAAVLSAGSLGPIKPTDAAPTPARNGNYTFSIGGNKPAWLTAEAGVTTVKAGDGVSVVYTEPSSYTYTHVDTGSSIEQVRSQSTGNVPSSKLLDDELNKTDIYNVTVKVPLTAGQFYTATTARAAVPNSIRKQGLHLRYSTSNREWVDELYIESTIAGWLTSTNWLPISGNIRFMGVALPSDTLFDSPLDRQYIASEAGIYTNKGNLVVNPGEIAMLTYLNATGWSKTIIKQNLLYQNNYWVDGLFNRKDYASLGLTDESKYVEEQNPFGNRHILLTGASIAVVSQTQKRTFVAAEEWKLAILYKENETFTSAGYSLYTNITGIQGTLSTSVLTELSDGWKVREFSITVINTTVNPFVNIQIQRGGTGVSTKVAGIFLVRNDNQNLYNISNPIVDYLDLQVKNLNTTIVVDDYNIVSDPYLSAEIENISSTDNNLVEIVELTSPLGKFNFAKYSTNAYFRLGTTLKKGNLVEGDVVVFEYLIYSGGTSIGSGIWQMLSNATGNIQLFSPTKTSLGNGWYKYTKSFTLTAALLLSDTFYAQVIIENLAQMPSGYIALSGFKLYIPEARYSKLKLFDESKRNTENISKLFKKSKNALYIDTSLKPVNVSGDSLTGFTFNTPLGYKRYSTFLQDKLGGAYQVNNFGVGGENSTQIAVRQGGIQLLVSNVSGITIPATTTPVALTFNVLNLIAQGDSLVNSLSPSNILGITGNISRDGNGIYYFTRLTAGDETFAEYGTQVYTNQQLNYKDGIQVIGSGTNDIKDSAGIANVLVNINKMIKWGNYNRYIIMLPHSDSTGCEELRTALMGEFSGNCVDIKKHFVREGLKVAISEGYITDAINNASYSGSDAYKHIISYENLSKKVFTGVDTDYLTDAGVLADIAANKVPRIFMIDSTHFNLIGMKLQAYFADKKLRLLNIIK